MKILHVVPSYLPATRYGGPIHSVHGLCRALAARGHEVHVFTTNVDGPGNSDVPLGRPVDLDGVKVWYFPSPLLRRLFYAPRMKSALAKQIAGFDLVHLHSVFLWPTLAAARAARRAGIPYVISPRGMLNRDLVRRKSRFVKTAWIRLFEASNIERAALLHLTSEVEREELARFDFSLPPVACIPNGIDVPAGFDDCGKTVDSGGQGVPYVLFLGRVHWKKGLDRLLRAWRHVAGAELVIAGNDEENYRPELERLAREEGVASRVRFLGTVTGDQKWALYRNAALFVLPSYSENFGVAVLEAMAAGCPVAVTPEVGLADTVVSEKCGILIEGSAESMGRAISSLLSDAQRRQELGARGREVAATRFGWAGIAARMEQVYAECTMAPDARGQVTAR